MYAKLVYAIAVGFLAVAAPVLGLFVVLIWLAMGQVQDGREE